MSFFSDVKKHLEANAKEMSPESPENGQLSAVLIPLRSKAIVGTSEIVLTKRSMTVETHRGHVSFPGGRWEDGDLGSLETALREAHEEIGLKKESAKILGRLPITYTREKWPIVPWVAEIPEDYEFSQCDDEVDKILFLRVADLLREGLKPVEIEVDPYIVKSSGITVEGEMVWGATARILTDLRSILAKAFIGKSVE